MDPKQQARLGALVAKVLDSVDLSSFPLVSAIDPYGYTVFNRLQRPKLADEMQRLARSVPEGLRAGVGELAVFIGGIADDHIYLWFIGD